MTPLSKQEKQKILSRLFWDIEINKIDVEKLLEDKIQTINHVQSQIFFTKLLTSCDWYTLIKLLPPAKLNLIFTDRILDKLFPKDLKQKYIYARQVLSRHTLSISGQSS